MNLRTLSFAALACFGLSSAALAQTVFTSNTTISDTNFSFDGQDIIVRGCTVTINGAHGFNSLIIERNVSNVAGVLTHTATFDNGTVKGMDLTIANGLFIEGVNGNLVASRIDVVGRGFGAATGPGAGANASQAGGGGHGGQGASGNPATANGPDYGLAYQPNLFGSGGGNDVNHGILGAPGGGVVRLTVNGTLTVNGSLSANGGSSTGFSFEPGAGAGGSIWMTVGALAGTGSITANGGDANPSWSGGGGGGRIALFTNTSSFTGALTACGGNGRFDGGAGTIFTKTPSQTWGNLLVSNCSMDANSITTLPGDPLTYDDVTIQSSATVTLPGASVLNLGNLFINGGGILNHVATQPGLTINTTGACAIAAGGAIDLQGRGFANATGPAAGGNASEAGGAGHGGFGGAGNTGGGGGISGTIYQPITLGSGGGNDVNHGIPGAYGGGAVRMNITGALTVDGAISAAGGDSVTFPFEPGAGAGGSLWLNVGSLGGSGVITTRGGNAHTTLAGGGGGGRIAIYTSTNSFTGTVSACGGNGRNDGGAGTIFTKTSSQATGSVLVDNCVNDRSAITDLPSGETTFDDITISRNAILDVIPPVTISTGTFTLATGATFTHRAGLAGLVINATGSMSIDATSAVNLIGRGFASLAGPGAGAQGSEAGGAGYGGFGGAGNSAPGGVGYGSALQPVDLGSGGGRDANHGINGANGGGAARFNIGGTLSVLGTMTANGANASALAFEPGSGSGGSLWLTVGALAGNGAITANGGDSNPTWAGGGGGGRIAIYTNTNTYIGALTACGGEGRNDGGAGSIYFKSSSLSLGNLFLDNCGKNTSAITDLPVGQTNYNTLALSNNAILDTPAPRTISVDTLTLSTGSTLTHRAGQAGLHVVANGNVTIDATSGINLGGRGFASQLGTSPGASGNEAGGAGHGGWGAPGNSAAGAATYGSIPLPIDLGSGGGRDLNHGIPGSNGGGAITLEAGGVLTVNGVLSANGASAVTSFEPGAGSGGSLQLIVGALAGTGSITSNGGPANSSWAGGGAGGRIALYTDADSFSGTLSACGGSGRTDGGAGTIFRKTSSQDFGTVLFDNCAHDAPTFSDLAGHTDFDALTVRNGSILDLPAPQNIYAGVVDIGTAGTLTHRAAQQGLQMFCASFTVETGGAVNLNGRGLPSNTGPGAGGNGNQAGGAGHGGTGGNGSGGAPGGGPYDSLVSPTQLGSGGGRDLNHGINGSPGGGSIFIGCAGDMLVNGAITANGANANTLPFEPGSGSGGAIWIVTNGLAGAGAITTRGGNSGGLAGGGAGGRISITSSNRTMPVAAIIAPGGTGFRAGDCGSVYLSQPGCTGNYDGNCETNSNDVTAYLDQWFADQANGTLYADVNHDGETNSNDVTFFLNAWFAALSGAC